jgi:hypothetical protein
VHWPGAADRACYRPHAPTKLSRQLPLDDDRRASLIGFDVLQILPVILPAQFCTTNIPHDLGSHKAASTLFEAVDGSRTRRPVTLR